MGRFTRGGSDRGARERVLSSYNSNRRRLLGSGSRSEGRSFTVTRGSSSRFGGSSRRTGGGNNGGRRFGGGDDRRGGSSRRIGGGRPSDRQRSGRSGAVTRRGDRQLGKRGDRNSSRAGKRPTRGDGPRRVRKGVKGQGRRGSLKNRRNAKTSSSGPADANSMDNMLEAYQQGKSQQEIRAAGRTAQFQSKLDNALDNYQNSTAAASNNNGGANLDNSLESYMKGN